MSWEWKEFKDVAMKPTELAQRVQVTFGKALSMIIVKMEAGSQGFLCQGMVRCREV